MPIERVTADGLSNVHDKSEVRGGGRRLVDEATLVERVTQYLNENVWVGSELRSMFATHVDDA